MLVDFFHVGCQLMIVECTSDPAREVSILTVKLSLQAARMSVY